MPEQHKPRSPHRLRGFWIFVLVVLALNWLSVLATRPGGQARVKVPFSPYFLNQLEAGEVKSISSTGDTIQGTFASKVRYPPNDAEATPTALFSTEVPTFWSDAELTALLRSRGVQVNAKSTAQGTSLLAEILLGFGPTLLFVGLFWLLARRASAGGMGALGNFGRSQARRVGVAHMRCVVEWLFTSSGKANSASGKRSSSAVLMPSELHGMLAP